MGRLLLCVVAIWVVWPRHHDGAAPPALQVAVHKDGFLVTHAGDGGRRVIELDTQGTARRTLALADGGDRRVVGTSIGTASAWLENKKLRIARVEDGLDMGTWGKSVRRLCDGVASNDARFGVAWLEADDALWVVFGPVSPAGADDASALELAPPDEPLARTDWCGVASAERNVALFGRSGDRLRFFMCSKRCSSLGGSFKLDHRLPILGFGCLRDVCLVAARDAGGVARVALLTLTSKSKWTKPLDAVSTVSIIGVGDRSFAVGYATKDGSEVVRLGRDGAVSPIWRDAASTTAPSLVWSSGRLLIAHHRGGALVHETIALAP